MFIKLTENKDKLNLTRFVLKATQNHEKCGDISDEKFLNNLRWYIIGKCGGMGWDGGENMVSIIYDVGLTIFVRLCVTFVIFKH